jgi:hypothetical protein
MRAALSQGLAGPAVLTLYIPSMEWYFRVEFHSWAPGNTGGGFSYTRTFLPELSGCAIVATLPGCSDPEADNYDPEANFDDGSCEFQGCTDPEALNYDPGANADDGSCIEACVFPSLNFEVLCLDEEDMHYYVELQISDLGNAAPYSLSDNHNSEDLVLNFTGTLVLGPFDNNEATTFELASLYSPCVMAFDAVNADCSANTTSELSIQDGFTLFPNPGDGRFFLRNGNRTFNGTLRIRDLAGREIWSQRLSVEPGATVFIEPGTVLRSGVYLAEISDRGMSEFLRFLVK